MTVDLAHYQSVFQEFLKKTNFPSEPGNLYNPIRYAIESGGKRMRPVLVLLGCGLYDNHIEKAGYAALAVELFHNFTLVHDDVMDKSTLRRGKETVHQKWNENIAILSGDALLIESIRQLTNYPAEIQARIIPHFCDMATTVCEGQQMDMDFELTTEVSIANYIEMVRKKTAALLGCSLQIGAIVGGAIDDESKTIATIGTQLGIAFQLQDDLLDAFGSTDKFGKKVGGDIVNNKKTFLMLKAFELANSSQRKELNQLLSENDEEKKINAVLKIYRDLKVDQLTLNEISHYHLTAVGLINGLGISNPSVQALLHLANNLAVRIS